MSTVLCIDQGTSGTKAVVVDGDDRIRAIAEIPIRPEYGSGGVVEQNPAELMASVLGSAGQAVDKAGIPIDAVAVANQGETVLAWDPATGAALSPMIVWQDSRARSICEPIGHHADLIARRTGLILDPYFTAPKLAWLRRNVTRSGVVTTSDAWIVHQLTGEIVTDVSTASRSLVTDLDTICYDDELLDIFGLEGEQLPRIVDNDEIVGETDLLGSAIPVCGLIVDQQAALLAEKCLSAGEAKCTFGTGAFLLTNLGGTPTRSGSGLTVSAAWRVAGETAYCSDGQVYTAASAIRWLQDTGLLSGAGELDTICTDQAHGVLCIPAMAGLAAPWWRADASATFHGITLATTRADIVTSVLQGLAAQVAELADLVAADIGRPLTRLRVDGGLTRSKVFMQSVADLMQIEIDIYPSAHATPLGAAALARKSLNSRLSLTDAIVTWQPEYSVAPRWSADRAQEFRDSWRQVVNMTLA